MKRIVSTLACLALWSAFSAHAQIAADPATARTLHDGPVVGYVDVDTGAQAWTNANSANNLMVFDSPKAGGVRMISDHESPTRIADDLLADKTVKSDDQRCQILKSLARDNPEIKAKAASCG